ncbi:hypothetical protein GO013_07320 [Pseudodesulfovibrio sp. JC047]|uniref:hypothetical protein n=1 Tax=Pseudodesulfovibrio sp. JC047 TaxID=2683199 RepID=UPI0013D71699|nr:hypothetical protein [Pseudodesulfovibrio sp. JC047]NDV19228.1 hypothetical protein [Pseudodesulfovibrio sp. JC047]
MIQRVAEQPKQLCGFEYAHEEYEWLEFLTPGGEVYAVVGLAFRGPDNEEAWMYWRILDPGLSAWRELKKKDAPAIRRYCAEKGAAVVIVASDDPGDVNFIKMVGFMGFQVRMFGFQRLEA